MEKLEIRNQNTGITVEAVSFVPEVTGELAIVDLRVIKRLASYLPKAPFANIKHTLISKISETTEIEEMVEILEDEIAFRRSVDLITIVQPEEVVELNPGTDPGMN